jgi:hypothetical protein
MLGFNAYMPDLAVWLRMQPDFPFKDNLLQLDPQTLQLVVFTFLLFMILAKVCCHLDRPMSLVKDTYLPFI